LIATTASDARNVSFREATAEGLVTARQKPPAPPSVERQATAAIGMRTISPR
jgi:hypothetical protein